MQPVPVAPETVFKLDDRFIEDYRDREVPWGFGDLSYITFKRTYARKLTRSILFPDRPEETEETESWVQCCRRVIEGMITVQKTHCLRQGTPWDEAKARRTARDAYDRLFHFKWTPPGRGLWMMGTDFVFERSGAALNSCGFVSTKDIDQDFGHPFGWAFEMAMLGVGVGFDTRGKDTVEIQQPEIGDDRHAIGDSREGWREALERLLNAFVGDDALPRAWDYSQIREQGAPIESFGGTASGPGPLREAIEDLTEMYHSYVGQPVDSRLIVDTFNITGRCVVAGGVRRSAQIALGDPDDQQFLELKQDDEKVRDYRWVSNNSPIVEVGQDYSGPAEATAINGEPGYFWLDNARKYGRMKDGPDHGDMDALGGNPCLEQILQNYELCNVCETFPAHHEDYEDFRRTLKISYLYAKTVTLIPTHSPKTNEVMLQNRRIGLSQSGIVQSINRHGYREHFNWCDRGYEYVQQLDRVYSDWLAVPRSIRTTSVKPSGTVSLLAGATSGVHWDHASQYVRRMEINKGKKPLELCREAGYPVEQSVYKDESMVVEFPIQVDDLQRGKADVPVREKVDLAAQMQYFWSDNAVSCTAEFDPETTGPDEIRRILEAYEHRLKGISFLPQSDHGYDQAPYEPIDEEEHERRRSKIEPIARDRTIESDQVDEFCSGEACEVDL